VQEKSTERQYLLIDDSVMALGGTALTLEALIKPNRGNVNTVATEYFRFNESDDLFYIVGNCLTLSQESFESLYYLFQKGNFCKIEFDYGFCQFRGPYPHKHFKGKECDCPNYLPLEQLYKGITKNAKKIFYMSDQQRDIHLKHLPDLNKDKTLRLSSTFLNENYKKFKELRSKEKNGKYAIIEGQGGWHTEAKGIKESVEYAQKNKIDYDLISTKSHDQMLELLSEYSGIIFLPIIEDTCPRVTIEAKLLGLDVITNNNSQHTTEEWWGDDLDKMEEYLSKRPEFLWRTLNEL
jgi:hypothetical protein